MDVPFRVMMGEWMAVSRRLSSAWKCDLIDELLNARSEIGADLFEISARLFGRVRDFASEALHLLVENIEGVSGFCTRPLRLDSKVSNHPVELNAKSFDGRRHIRRDRRFGVSRLHSGFVLHVSPLKKGRAGTHERNASPGSCSTK
jgi:hypothetical protein